MSNIVNMRTTVRWHALPSLLFVLGTATTASAEIISESQPFVSPKGSYVTDQGAYHTFRIPGMIVAPDGAVLTFAEGRRGDGSDPRRDDNAPIDLVMRRTTDNGRTWDEMVVVDSGFKSNGAKVDFGDPTPVRDDTADTIFLFYGQWPDVGSITADVGQHPDSADNNQVVWVRSSADNGITWSPPTQILYPDQPGDTLDGLYWRQAEPGPGNGIQLNWQGGDREQQGRLVIPAKRSGSSTPTGSATVEPFVYYSDDHGVTWNVGNVTPGPDANEDEVVELTNGSLLLDARQNSGNFRRRHSSTDGGVTWGANNPAAIAITAVDGSMNRYSSVLAGHDRNRILFSGPRGEGGLNRNNITVWTSYDEGQSFINPVQLNNEFAAYSVVQRLADGTIGLLVETENDSGQSYGDITFINFGMDHLEGAEHPAETSHFDGFGNPLDPLRGGVGWSGAWQAGGSVAQKQGGLEFPTMAVMDDIGRLQFTDGDVTRSLGVKPIDLSVDEEYFFSLFVRGDDDGVDAATGEWLDVRLLDEAGGQQLAWGVISTEAFFVRDQDVGSSVLSEPDAAATGETYFLLAKIAASRNGDDQLLLAWYDQSEAIPADPSEVNWQLVGQAVDLDGIIEDIFIGGGTDATWNVDALRVGTTYDAVVFTDGVIPDLPGDLTGDGLIDLEDWLAFKGNYGLDTADLSQSAQEDLGDFDFSGLIDLRDFAAFAHLYDEVNGDGQFAIMRESVPESTGILLLASGLVWLGSRGCFR